MRLSQILLLLVIFSSACFSQVKINEFLARNTTVNPDNVDFSDYSDWLELYNTQGTSVDLTGYYLTDDLDEPLKWEIPAGTVIGPHQTIIFWADGFDAAPGEVFMRESWPWENFVTQGYHTNFKLDFFGEEIGLFKSQDTTITLIDSVTFDRQISDVSMGRNISANYTWYYYGEPTPGRINVTNPVSVPEQSHEVGFSLAAGFYSGTQTLELSTSANEQIYYTTNGSDPTIASEKYVAPIVLSGNSVIRARTIVDGKLPGPITSNTYFVYEIKSTLPVISLIIDPPLFWDDEIGIYSNSMKNREIPLSVEYFDPEGTRQFKVNAGARIGGYNIWRFAQKPLNIYLNDKYGDDEINFKLFDKNYAVFKSFGLRNGGDNWPTTMLQDAMAESIVKDRMEAGVQAYKPCVVYINGSYWGIHNIRERLDEQYFAANYNADPYNIDHVRYNLLPPNGNLGLELEKGTIDDYNALVEFAATHDLSSAENYDYMKSKMDVISFIDFIAAEVYVCNTSWRHNREWWKSTNNGGRWQWQLPDIDRGFNYDNISRNVLDNMVNEYSLFHNLLDNSEFKNSFVQRFAAHLNSTFSPERISVITDSLSSVLEPEMERHITRWSSSGGISSINSWQNELNRIKNFAADRITVVFNQIRNEINVDETVIITINSNNHGSFYFNGVPVQSLSELKFFKNIPIEIIAVPKPGYKFSGWLGSGSDTLLITPQQDVQFTASFIESSDIVLPGMISTNTTLSNTGAAYLTSGDLTVPENVTLKIDRGVTIKMPENAGIYVKGRLLIEGTEDEPVSISTDSKPGNKNWAALCFENAVDTSYISYLKLSGAVNGADPVNQKGAISANNSNLVLDHCLISNVIFPIFVNGGSIVLKNSELSATGTCDYIGVKQGNARITNNIFWGNNAPDTDGIDLDGDNNAVVEGNRMYNFSGFNCDAIDIGENSSNIHITGNYIFNSSDKGISVGQRSTAWIDKNIILGCNLGVAVKDESEVVADKNTFFMNNIAVSCYEKNFGNGGGHATISNSILSASKISSIYKDELSTIEVSYSLSDMDLLAGEHNIFSDPGFKDLLNYELELSDTSVCLVAGKTSDGNQISIGADYVYEESDLPLKIRLSTGSDIVINEIMYADNISDGRNDWIELYNSTDENINLSGWLITDEDSTHTFVFPEGTEVNADDYLVVCSDTALFNAVYDGVKYVIGDLDFGLGNTDKVRLFDALSTLRAFVSYTDSYPWPFTEDNSAVSIELKNPAYINYRTVDWAASGEWGTPGRKNKSFVSSVDSRKRPIPVEYSLLQNYPNPFNPSTAIRYSLPERAHVKIKIFNVLGEELVKLVDDILPAGSYSIRFNAEAVGQPLASGVYIYRLETGEFMQSRKMLLLK